ncbi:MAG TPA: hypothetical protein VGC34_14965, partial [Steroidobacteraceae bacterium]
MKNVVLLLTCLLSGCATSPVSTDAARTVPDSRVLTPRWRTSAPSSGTLLVKRDSGFLGGGCAIRLSIDGVPAADLRTSEKIEFDLPPGEHLLAAGGNTCVGITTQIVET